MVTLIWILVTILVLAAAAYFRTPGWIWAVAAAASLAGLTLRGGLPPAVIDPAARGRLTPTGARR